MAMIINKKNFALNFLKGKHSVKLRLPVEAKDYLKDIEMFSTKLRKVNTRIFALSKEFSNAMLDASPSIIEAWNKNNINLEDSIQCCILLPGGDRSYFVDLRPVGSGVKGRVMVYNRNFNVDGFMIVNTDPVNENRLFTDGFSARGLQAQSEEAAKQNDVAVWLGPLACLLYMQYGEIETRRVANEKVEAFPSMVIHNKTQVPITAVNSTWLTNIVRLKGFKVSGHFRFQRIGKGRKKTKLIWIETYEKNGYNRSNDRWREMPTPKSSE